MMREGVTMRAGRWAFVFLTLALCLVCSFRATSAPAAKTDVNGDGVVNILDLVAISSRYGLTVQTGLPEDVNRNGIVDLLDFVLVSRAMVPSMPASLPQATAWVSQVAPTQYSDITVYGKLTQDGVGIRGASMQTTWHYRTTTSYCDGVSGGDGIAACTRFISTATRGYYVSVTVEFSYQGQHYVAGTGFTPQSGAATSVSTQPSQAVPAPKPSNATSDSGCCKHCSPNSKPCGDSCSSLRYTCHKGAGCACW
jgi:hypothetical protein